MSVGVVTPTVPVANDIVYGEFKIYANYELPTQLELGATNGGLKVDIERSIRDMSYDGSYGVTKGLRRYEKLFAKVTIDSLCHKYFNNKIISDCESTGLWESQDWANTGGTYTAETTIVAEGSQSAKANLTTTVHGIKEVFAADKDLTVFDNTEVSTVSDYIGFSIYITTAEISDLGTSKIRIAFHNDIEGTLTNYVYYDVTAAMLANGWNDFKVLKSAFTTVLAGAWTGVKGISFSLNGAPSAAIEFYVDGISLIQSQTKSTIVPVNAGGFSYTDEGNYRKFVANLEITDAEYFENVAVVGQKHDGKAFIIIMKNMLDDGNISLALKEKEEVITQAVLTAHYSQSAPITSPIVIRDYDI